MKRLAALLAFAVLPLSATRSRAAAGADAASNMQWQTIEDAKAKDKRE